MANPLHNHNGSVLPLVLIFSSIAFITVAAFVSGQYLIGKPSLMAPGILQAQLNARSGIWKALDIMNHPPDTLKAINTLDSTFGKGLFGKPHDTSSIRSPDLIADDSVPLAIQPFSCDSFGTCEVSLSYSGCFQELRSKGTFINKDKYVQVRIGGKLSVSSDTVLYLDSGIALQTPIRGKYRIGPRDSASGIRSSDLNKLITHFSNELSDSGIDTMMTALPLLVQHKDEFDKIKPIVKGPLFIDGSHFDLAWKSDKKITVLGDLQITGKVVIEGLTFVVVGETRILDNAHLDNVTVFSSKRISIENKAVFSGTAITLANLLVSGNATVENRSMLVITPGISSKPEPPLKPGEKPKLKPFSATFIESATIDATIIAYKNPLGIKIGSGAIVKGILWTNGAMSLDGKVNGIIYAGKLVDGDQAISGVSMASIAVIRGNIFPLEDFDHYYFPFFLGKLSLISWLEQ
jgi:cytoskeletal protein CcmA (bactofilin family)